MYRGKVALFFGFLAVLCIVVTGAITEARTETILERGIIACAIAGIFSYLLAAWLESDIVAETKDEATGADAKNDAASQQPAPARESTDSAEKKESDNGESKSDSAADNGGGEFKPLTDENLERVQSQ